MKAVIVLVIWFIGYIVTLFLTMLLCRLSGEEPEDVYELDDTNMQIYMVMIVAWPLFFILEFLGVVFLFTKKWFIAVIETIVAIKDVKEGNDE